MSTKANVIALFHMAVCEKSICNDWISAAHLLAFVNERFKVQITLRQMLTHLNKFYPDMSSTPNKIDLDCNNQFDMYRRVYKKKGNNFHTFYITNMGVGLQNVSPTWNNKEGNVGLVAKRLIAGVLDEKDVDMPPINRPANEVVSNKKQKHETLAPVPSPAPSPPPSPSPMLEETTKPPLPLGWFGQLLQIWRGATMDCTKTHPWQRL